MNINSYLFDLKKDIKTNSISKIIVLVLIAFFGNIQLILAQQPEVPKVPSTSYNIISFGAVGDNSTLNTVSIQSALDKVAETGGQLIIPKGVFLTGPLELKSRTNLVLEKGAVLRLRNDINEYPSENERYLNFISVKKATDVKISGEGTIDGQGKVWWEKFTAKEITFRRPQMLIFDNCERIEISGITTLDPPNTHISLKNCKEVYIHDITISAPEKSRNTDGINISARNCLIERCTINTGDDNIAINFGNKKENEPEIENFTIRNCKFGYGHGLSIGSYTSGNLKNLKVYKCSFDGTTSAIRIKSARGRGGIVENISYEDIDIKNVRWPIYISKYYTKEPKNYLDDPEQPIVKTTPIYRNISLKNINVTNAENAIKIWGLPESQIEGLVLTNVNIDAKKGVELYHVNNVKFENCKINISSGERIIAQNSTFSGLK